MAEQKGAMPNPVISTEGLPREEWLAYRRKGIGGSDAAAVLKSDDPARVIDILKSSGFDVYSADEAYRANQ